MKDRKEIKVSARAMDSAMILRLFRDALESERPLVSRMRWEPDQGEGAELELGPLEPHPSFGDSRQAASRVGSRIAALVSGESSEGDKKPVLRCRSEDGACLDFSMESFDHATLGEDGQLLIMAGALDGELGAREDMPLQIEASIRLYGAAGYPLRRDQALFPIRELVEIRRDWETQELMAPDQGDGGKPVPEGAHRDFLSRREPSEPTPAGWGEGEKGEQALRAMQEPPAALGWGSRPRRRASDGPEQAAAPEPSSPAVEREATVSDEPESLSPESARDMLLAAFSEHEPASMAAAPALAPASEAQALMDQALAKVQQNIGATLRSQPLPAGRVPAAAEPGAQNSEASPAPASLKDVKFLPVAFDPLPDGHDEIAFSVEPSDLPGLLAMLAESSEFEARLVHKEGARMRLALAAPRGGLAAFNPLVERYAKSGVMIRRAKGKAS